MICAVSVARAGDLTGAQKLEQRLDWPHFPRRFDRERPVSGDAGGHDLADFSERGMEPLTRGALGDEKGPQFHMGLGLVLAGTEEDGQGAYTEALPGRNLSTTTVGIIATTNFDDLRRVGAEGDVEVGHVKMVVFSYGRTYFFRRSSVVDGVVRLRLLRLP